MMTRTTRMIRMIARAVSRVYEGAAEESADPLRVVKGGQERWSQGASQAVHFVTVGFNRHITFVIFARPPANNTVLQHASRAGVPVIIQCYGTPRAPASR